MQIAGPVVHEILDSLYSFEIKSTGLRFWNIWAKSFGSSNLPSVVAVFVPDCSTQGDLRHRCLRSSLFLIHLDQCRHPPQVCPTLGLRCVRKRVIAQREDVKRHSAELCSLAHWFVFFLGLLSFFDMFGNFDVFDFISAFCSPVYPVFFFDQGYQSNPFPCCRVGYSKPFTGCDACIGLWNNQQAPKCSRCQLWNQCWIFGRWFKRQRGWAALATFWERVQS